jgi:hypothetical protein
MKSGAGRIADFSFFAYYNLVITAVDSLSATLVDAVYIPTTGGVDRSNDELKHQLVA